MAKSSSSLVRSQRQARRSENFCDCFKDLQIDHVSLTSTDSYRCDSYCLARVFQNLPAPPKHYGVFDLKTWGRTWQCAPMIDFYGKVNKFFKKFAKCDLCLTWFVYNYVTDKSCKWLRNARKKPLFAGKSQLLFLFHFILVCYIYFSFPW